MTAAQVQEQFSGDTLAQVMDARQLFAGLAWHEPLLAAVERLATVPFHIAMSLLVLLVFTRKQIRWLFWAILLHGLADLTAVLLNQAVGDTPWLVELGVLAWGLAALWYILRRYRQDRAEQQTIQEAV